MDDVRGAKLIASAILAGAGCISLAADLPPGGAGSFFGFILFVGGLGLFARQWFAGIDKRLMPALSREHELEIHQAPDKEVRLRSDSEEIYVKSPRQE